MYHRPGMILRGSHQGITNGVSRQGGVSYGMVMMVMMVMMVITVINVITTVKESTWYSSPKNLVQPTYQY